MILFVAMVALMMAVTYAWDTGLFGGARKLNNPFSRVENPFQGRHTSPPGRGKSVDKGSMTRCHQCACFFPAGQVIHQIVDGHVLEFCSESCKVSFHAPRH